MSPWVTRIGAAAALLAPVSLSQAPPDQPALTFQTGVDVIRLDVSVTDSHNRFLGGLSESDFAVFEDGVPQSISFFTSDPVPLRVALLVDCSDSMTEKLPAVQEAATRFINALAPQDTGEIVEFGSHVAVLQDFTADKQELREAVRKATIGGSTALYDALYVTLKQLAAPEDARHPTRRAVVLLSDGEDTASVATDDQVLDLARRSEVGVYPICLRSDRPEQRSSAAFGEATYFLTSLARDTGGEAHFPERLSTLNAVYGRIAEDLRSRYTLGYVPAAGPAGGKWRRIQVRTPGRKDLGLRYKIGYYGPG